MQIIALQFAYYLTLSFSVLMMDSLTGHRPHLGQLFSPSAFDLSLDYSFLTIVANFVNIGFVIMAEAYIVEKANRCLDFSLTILILHVMLTWMVYRFPSSFNWWFMHGVIITITILASEFICLRLETAEIKLSINHIVEKGKEIGRKVGTEVSEKIANAK